ncbi:hypothetical protein HQ29_05140 [Porphyromonas canoris]|nr:hypothetical protein HQ29_05140 [Porphyromonas canoris]
MKSVFFFRKDTFYSRFQRGETLKTDEIGRVLNVCGYSFERDILENRYNKYLKTLSFFKTNLC